MDSIASALELVAADKGHICGSLYYIRSNITNSVGINELRDRGGIKILVKCLKQVNPKVLSLALSILGNCSMNEECRNQLFEYGIIKDLVFIMKNINVDAIDNRTCRMIANLSVSQAHIPVIYKHNLPSIIVKILLNTKCDATRYSAIRALRKIWENSSRKGCSVMLKCEAVTAVSELLTSKSKDIVTAVLRAQSSFLFNSANSKYVANNTLIIEKILGKDPESTLDTLMDLLPEQPLVNRIIYSMCEIPCGRELMHSSTLIMRITDVLKNEKNHYLRISLCHLLKCPMNRESFSRNDIGINVYMDIISSENSTQKEFAICTLLHFKYCIEVLEKMSKKGLVSILVKNLSSYIQANKVPDSCHLEIKSKSPEPRSLNSAYIVQASPESDNLTPPKENNITIDSFSPYYSPVCESFENESFNADESKSDVSEYEVQNDEDLVEMDTPEKSTKKCYIIHLLTNLAFVENIVIMMASKDLWETVLDYIQHIKYDYNSNPIKILKKISKEVRNFKTILTDGFIISTHQRMCRPIHTFDKCKYCKLQNELGERIIKNAISSFESSFAEDIMLSILNEQNILVSNQSLKLLVSVTVPHVIQSQPNKLLALLCRYKVYENLCNIIKDDQNALFDDAVGAIMALFKTLNFTYPEPVSKLCEQKNCQAKIIRKETTVTLALDDGTLIDANKSYLSLKSPMFEAMFRCGGFKEAYQSTIHLNDVSSECFKSFLLLLELYCDCLLPENINVLLELIMVTDRYMLNELSEKIGMVMINSISINNCDIIYEWVKETGHQLNFVANVGSNVVKYLFSSNSRFPNRVKAIKNIIKSNYGQHFIEDLSTILKLGFSNVCLDDNSNKFYLRTFDCRVD